MEKGRGAERDVELDLGGKLLGGKQNFYSYWGSSSLQLDLYSTEKESMICEMRCL